MNDDKLKWQILSSKYLLNTKWLTVREDHVRMPSGVEMEDYYVLEYPDWINVIGRTGLLVGRRNSKDLAEKIAWMIDHPTERTAMGIAGCRLYRNKFTLLAFENMFANILEKILQDD